MYIYMQINIWELIKPLNTGKFWQSKNMRADLGTKEEKNISFIGKDMREGKEAASKQRKGLCNSTSSSPRQRGSLLVRSGSRHKEKNKSNKPQRGIQALAYRGRFHSPPLHCAVQHCQPHIMQPCWGREALLLPATECSPGPAGHRTQTLFARARSPLSTCVKQLKAMRGVSALGRYIERMSWFAAAGMATCLESILLVAICYLLACTAGDGGSIQWQTS